MLLSDVSPVPCLSGQLKVVPCLSVCVTKRVSVLGKSVSGSLRVSMIVSLLLEYVLTFETG